MVPYITVISFLLIGMTHGQAIKQEWGPDDLENPITHALECGFSSPEPAYICDPNNLLGDHLGPINWILKDAAYNSTRCPCSNYYCETTRQPTGYRIAVALVKRIKPMTSTDGKIISPRDKAQIFAYTLENSKWNMGMCEEDIVVFYSVEDKVLAIYSGVTAGQKLTSYYKELVAHKAGSRLDDGMLVEGLNHIIHDIKLVLNCESPEKYDCNLYEFKPGHASSNIASITLVLIAAVLSFLRL